MEKTRLCFCCFISISIKIRSHEVFKRISEFGAITIHWFCDDHWRFEKYSSKIAHNFDFICTTAESVISKYKTIGISGRVIKTQWACNNELYFPYDIEKDIILASLGNLMETGRHNKKIINTV